MTEPEWAKKRGRVARDAEGDYWRRGIRWWHRIGGRGKLLWPQLNEMYGPLGVGADTEARER